MADGVQFSITGLDALLGKLDAVSYDMKRKGGRAALRKAAQLVAAKAKANAERSDDPKTPEHIANNIVVRWSPRRFKRTGNLMFRVGVMGGAGSQATTDKYAGLPGGDTRHWRLLEFGASHMAAQPFMRPALEGNINAATDTFIVQYEKSLDRALKRAKKKAGRS